MSNQMAQLQEATIKAHCKSLRMPTVATQFGSMAEQAVREKKSHIGYLEALLLAEIEERERNTVERRIKEAHLPRVKTLEEFDYTQSPNVTAAKMRDLAEGGYIERAEPVLFIGECGTGKTHLLTGLCVAACRQKRRVRFTTAAGLVNELVEAKHQLQLRRVMARWKELRGFQCSPRQISVVCVTSGGWYDSNEFAPKRGYYVSSSVDQRGETFRTRMAGSPDCIRTLVNSFWALKHLAHYV